MSAIDPTILPNVVFEVKAQPQQNINIFNRYPVITKVINVAWNVFSTVVFPIGITCSLINIITPRLILPASGNFSLDLRLARLKALGDQKILVGNQRNQLEESYINIIEIHKNREQFIASPENNAEQITIKTEDGVKLDTLKIKNPNSNKWIVYFCPNAACYEQMMAGLKQVSKATGANIYTGNYRGVMRSEGQLKSSQDMINDGKALIEKLLSEGVPQEDILIHGHSIGGAVSIDVAALYPKVNLCNDRSFASLGHFLRGWVPVIGGLLGRVAALKGWKFNGVKNINKVSGEKLIIYSKMDWVVSFDSSSLFKAAKKAKFESLELNDVFTGDKNDYIKQWKQANPKVKENEAYKRASRAFAMNEGMIHHCIDLQHTSIYDQYIAFVKKALKLA